MDIDNIKFGIYFGKHQYHTIKSKIKLHRLRYMIMKYVFCGGKVSAAIKKIFNTYDLDMIVQKEMQLHPYIPVIKKNIYIDEVNNIITDVFGQDVGGIISGYLGEKKVAVKTEDLKKYERIKKYLFNKNRRDTSIHKIIRLDKVIQSVYQQDLDTAKTKSIQGYVNTTFFMISQCVGIFIWFGDIHITGAHDIIHFLVEHIYEMWEAEYDRSDREYRRTHVISPTPDIMHFYENILFDVFKNNWTDNKHSIGWRQYVDRSFKLVQHTYK